ncbi:MAG TPA: TonB family protein [Methylomirabilota bacterium]|nr:TonB family protein [Methylomirabilota bacterium]
MTNSATKPMRDHSLVEATTLAIWTLASAVCVAGFALAYTRPKAPEAKLPTLVAEVLQVELTTVPSPAPSLNAPSASAPPPLDAQPITVSEAPALTPVADPSLVAFALPVEGPVAVVEPKRAAYVAPAVTTNLPAPAQPIPATAQKLVYGQGEGRQPAPEYPYRARREGQEGSVTVRFSVAESGQVIAAEASNPSPWPALNDAATKVVRERWRFTPGAPRLYEVVMHFKLTR